MGFRPHQESPVQRKMSAAFGVHFGCTSACLAVHRDGKTDVVANELGDRVTPCIVAFTDHDQAVGGAAKQGLIRNSQNTVCNVKQVLGRRSDDPAVVEYRKNSTASVVDQNGEPVFEIDYKEARKKVTPSQIAEAIYKKILETAQSHGGNGIQASVLSVPLNFSQEQRKAISHSAKLAGFSVLRLISDPSAAVLAYDIGQDDINTECTVLVLRVGGLSSDATLVHVQHGMYRVLTSVSNDFGGNKFTSLMAEYLVTEFQRQNRHDIRENKRSMAKIHRAAETCKHSLSTLENTQCAVDSLYDGMDFHVNVSRARFEGICSGLVQQCTQLVDQVLSEAKCSREAVDKVLLCGGGMKVPLLQKTVSELFSSSEILSSLNPEEVIAIGAAKQAGILLSYDEEDIKLNSTDTEVDCLARAVSIKTIDDSGDKITPVFPKLSPLHARRHLTFVLEEGQSSLLLEVCEVDDSNNEPVTSTLAKIVMRELPKGCKVNATFHLRREGSLHITCVEPTSNKTESVTIEVS